MQRALLVRGSALGLMCAALSMTRAVEAGAEPREARAQADAEMRDAGRELFERVWQPNDRRSHGGDGLGPVFNAQSCVACHALGGTGGAGRLNVEVATANASRAQGYNFSYSFGMNFGGSGFEYRFVSNPPASSSGSGRGPRLDPRVVASIHPGFRRARSVVLHLFGTDPAYRSWREGVPGPHGTVDVTTSLRNPTALFGAGRIDAIPDAEIEAVARRARGGIKGRISRLGDGRIGRFGWKAQAATLEDFALGAAATELGLDVPGHPQAADPRLPGLGAPGLDMSREECDALVAYVRSLPVPEVRTAGEEGDDVASGEATFRAIGCADCHLPKLGDVDGLYSDLLLHEMGARLADTDAYGVFVGEAAGADGPEPVRAGGRAGGRGASSSSAREWRTAPLWGLRDSAPYLHDGRAATVGEAIALHGGQGAASARRYAQLTARRKRQIDSFLGSLRAPVVRGE